MRNVFIFLLLKTAGLPAQTWLSLADFPASKRDDGVAVAVNNKAYFGTGLQEGWSAVNDFRVLDLTSFSWGSIEAMPATAERQYACAFPGSNCFYVFGGDGVGGALNNLFTYDIAADTWSLSKPKPGNGLIGAACMVFGDKVIFAGGKFTGAGPVSEEVWEYSISGDSWSKKNNFPFGGRWRAGGTVLNSAGYYFGGLDGNGSFRNELFRYDPGSDTWTKLPDFPAPDRVYSAFQAVNNKLVLFGGYDTLNNYYNEMWIYHPGNNQWAQGASLPAEGRRGGMSCAAGERFIYCCGLNKAQDRLREAWLLDIPVSLKEMNTMASLMLYPNPVIDELLIQHSDEGLVFGITDITGREIFKRVNNGGPQKFDLSGMPGGIYFLQLSKNGMVVETLKLVKE